ncbi:MAG TPA: hypothetical protein VGL51_19825 [Solirubrobacteraceae bacterium]
MSERRAALRDRTRWLVGALAISLVVLSYLAASPARAAPQTVQSPAQQLADKYSPIVMVRKQTDGICDSSEEQYSPPTSVDSVLGNPRVKLLSRVGRKTEVLKRAPTVADIAGRNEGVYLDLPGSPLSPGCKFAKDFAALKKAGKAPAITYAHIAREPGHSGFALQYWFFYYFNHFNDLHEGDWEGMQITFNAETPKQALGTEPDQIVLFQHSGGEHDDWDDSKVEKQGTHPVVYSAAGSHALFYSAGLWLGNGQNGSGVGCDDTAKPLVAVKPKAVLLPDQPPNSGKFGWLSFTGRWGQREAGFNNGPAGPSTKVVWREPFTWMDGTRSQSPQVPGGSLMGPSVANLFCGAVKQVTSFLNLSEKSTPAALGIAVGLLLVILVPLGLTKWRPVQLEPLRQARRFGQLLLTSGRLYWRCRGPLTLIALSALVVLVGFEGLDYLLRQVLNANGSGLSFTDSKATISVSAPAGIGRILATPIVSSVVVAFVRDLDRPDRKASFIASWGAVLRRLWRLLVVQLLANLLVLAMLITIIGIPFGIKKFIDWQFVAQEVLFEDRSIREAMRGSTRVVHGHWWHTGLVAGVLWLLSQIPGPVVGFALLFTTVPVIDVNLIGSVVFALLIPFVEIGRTLLYFDCLARQAEPVVSPSVAIAPAGA